MRQLIFLLIISVLSTALLAKDNQPSFVVATPFVSDVPPYLWRDRTTNKVVGSVIDANELMAKKLGYQLQCRFYHPVDDRQTLLQEYKLGNIAMFLNMPPSNIDDSTLLKLEASMISVDIHAFAPIDHPLTSQGVEALAGYHGITDTLAMNSLSANQAQHPALKNITILQKTNSLTDLIALLEKNNADYSISEHAILSLRLREMGLTDQYQIIYPRLARIPTVILYKPSSDFGSYHKAFLMLSEQFYNNGRFKHLRERNMRQYINQAHPSTK